MTISDSSTSTRDPLRILIVDDDDVDRMALVRALRSVPRPVKVSEAVDMASGLSALRRGAFDCALVDLRLPDGDGLELLARTRTGEAANTPIVIVTGLDDEVTAVSTLQEGAQDYIVKGQLGGKELWRAISYAMQRKKVTELQQQLIHADRLVAIGQLAAGVAHEINNPATFVLANMSLMNQRLDKLEHLVARLRGSSVGEAAALLLDDLDADEHLRQLHRAVEQSLEGINRIVSIVKDLATFSRVEHEDIEAVRINDVIEVACRMTSNEIKHRARLVQDLGEVPYVMGNRAKLAQVVTNLLLNAAQAIDSGEAEENEVRVSSRLAGGFVVVSVADTGKGISDEIQHRIFDPFFTTKERGYGTGLGLPLSAEIVHKYGGELRVVPLPEGGTRFDVLLPPGKAACGSELPEPRPPIARPRRRSCRVLIIDDEPLVLDAFSRMLEGNVKVVAACGGAEALAILARDEAFDAIVCDLMMPEMDGIEVFKQIAHRWPGLQDRVIFCTGGAFTPVAKDFLHAASNPWISKPVPWDTLLGLLEDLSSRGDTDDGGTPDG